MYPRTQKMTSFQENTNIMRMILLFIFFGFLGTRETLARYVTENPLVELSSGDELRRVAGYGDEKLSTVLVTGSILCDVCLDKNSPLQYPVSGASIAVSCETRRKTGKSDQVRGTTDEYGDFLVDLPSHLHAIPNMEKKCIARILELPKTSPCHRAFTDEHRTIKLSTTENGFRTYTAHEFHLTPKDSHPCSMNEHGTV